MKEPSAELRAQVPRRLVDMLDAVSIARGCHRTELLVEVLENWHRSRVREATLIQRVMACMALPSDSIGELEA